jgi:nucleoside-diphosphate-sugar epimerase
MNILVTGGLGLIGHNVVRRLKDQGHRVVVVDNCTNYGIIPQDELDYLLAERLELIHDVKIHRNDLLEISLFDYLIPHYQIDSIVHLASFPRQKVVNSNPQWGSRVMSEGLIAMLEKAKQYKLKRFVYISSSMVYGDFEDQVTEDAVCSPQGQYGIMKLAGEWLVRDYHRRTGIEYVIIRPSAVYGPLDVEDRVISKFILTAMRGGTINVNGATETLDFTYVTDAADGIVAATTLPAAANNTFNITKSHSKSLLAAAELAVSIVGKGSINVRDRDLDFPSRGALNIDKARQLLAFDPKVDIEEGFQRYYEWLNNSVYWSKKAVS